MTTDKLVFHQTYIPPRLGSAPEEHRRLINSKPYSIDATITFAKNRQVTIQNGVWFDLTASPLSCDSSSFMVNRLVLSLSELVKRRLREGCDGVLASSDFEGRTMVLVGAPGSYANYGHFLGDAMTQLLFAVDLLRNNSLLLQQPVFLLPEMKTESLRKSSKELAGALLGRTCDYDFIPNETTLSGDVAILKNFLGFAPMPKPLLLLRSRIQTLTENSLQTVDDDCPKATIIYRVNKFVHDPNRDIDTESYEFIEETLTVSGFDVDHLFPTQDTQLAAFSKLVSADLVIGVLGAGSSRAIVCKPGATFICISPREMAGLWDCAKSEILNINYIRFPVDNWKPFGNGKPISLSPEARSGLRLLVDSLALQYVSKSH